MSDIEMRTVRLAATRVEAALARIATADLPAGLLATREGDAVIIRGRGLVTALAHDPRLRGLAGAPR